MPKITVLPHVELAPMGAVIEVPAGTSICTALLDNGIEIEHACDQSRACTTCHCVVRNGFDSLNEIEECEDDLLDRAWGLEPLSRLSCQAIVAGEDLTGDDDEILVEPHIPDLQPGNLGGARGEEGGEHDEVAVGLVDLPARLREPVQRLHVRDRVRPW